LLLSSALVTAGASGCAEPSAYELVNKRPWRVTVYYTAVESFHHDATVPVTGCTDPACANGEEFLGEYPQRFVTVVREEGSGRITNGERAGRYLNWSHDIGFWLDTAPRDAHGHPLQPFHTAAADELPDGMKLRLVDCGRFESGEPVPEEVCTALRGGQWEITDRFTPGLGGRQHIDLYIGEEPEENFTASGALYVSLQHARFTTEG
jgi:hypothetical protein